MHDKRNITNIQRALNVFETGLFFNDEHPLKASRPISDIEERTDIVTNDEQLRKAKSPISFRFGIDICVNDEQNMKA